MTPTDAVNVLKFLERTRANENNPEGAAMLHRVEAHLSAWVSKATSDPINDGGPAFPWGEHGTHLGGISMRDYFAAKAMQGFAADQDAAWKDGANGMACCAYEWADAMLNARDQKAGT